MPFGVSTRTETLSITSFWSTGMLKRTRLRTGTPTVGNTLKLLEQRTACRAGFSTSYTGKGIGTPTATGLAGLLLRETFARPEPSPLKVPLSVTPEAPFITTVAGNCEAGSVPIRLLDEPAV